MSSSRVRRHFRDDGLPIGLPVFLDGVCDALIGSHGAPYALERGAHGELHIVHSPSATILF
jgi:hypothetical protein